MSHQNEVTSSDLLTADTAVCATSGLLYGVTLIPAAAASTVVIYDNPSAASGKVMAKVQAVANGESVYIGFNSPVGANTGIYADVAGASAAFIVHFAKVG